MERYGQYELVAPLAVGGMAELFLARPAGSQGASGLVVVKRILPSLAKNKEFVSMFLQEARVVARLNHPGIAQILELGKVGDSYFIAMEYVRGDDFRNVVRQAKAEGRSLTAPLVCRMIIGASEGLHFAHTATDENESPLKIVHRDVSPQNLLLTFDADVKLIDFGVAKAADSGQKTRTGVLKGKYAYMSPEQVEGKVLDARSDVFALGVVMYELITQTRLFKRRGGPATLRAVDECRVPRPSQHNPALDPALEAIILRTLARDREARIQSAAELASELDTYLATHRLPGSRSHLRQFIQEIYATRITEEKQWANALEGMGSSDGTQGADGATVTASDVAAPRVPSPPGRRTGVQLAPMPSHRKPLAFPPLPRRRAGADASISRVVRRDRTRKLILATLALVLFGSVGGAVMRWMGG